MVITFHLIHHISYSYFRLMKICKPLLLCIITPFKCVYPPADFNALLSITFCLVFNWAVSPPDFTLHPSFSPYCAQFSFRRGKDMLCQLLRGGSRSCMCFCHYIAHPVHVYLSCPYSLDLWSRGKVQTCYLWKGEPGTDGLVPLLARPHLRWRDLSQSHSKKLDWELLPNSSARIQSLWGLIHTAYKRLYR